MLSKTTSMLPGFGCVDDIEVRGVENVAGRVSSKISGTEGWCMMSPARLAAT